MSDLGNRYRVLQNLDHGEEPPAAFFNLRLLDTPLPELRSEHWATSEQSLAELGRPLMRAISEHSETVVVDHGSALLLVSLRGGFVVAQAAGPDEQTVLDAIRFIRDRLPAPSRSPGTTYRSRSGRTRPTARCRRCARSPFPTGARSRATTRRRRERS